MHSKSWSGFIFGSHNVSHIPINCSSQVPPATKSTGSVMHPIRSMLQIEGLKVTGSRPATMGSTKKGPKRLSYNMLETILAKVLGFICLLSFSSYMFIRNSIFCFTVWMSVARPGRPTHR